MNGEEPPIDNGDLIVRDRITTLVRTSIAQPITGLAPTLYGLDARNAEVRAVRHQEQATAHDVVLAVTNTYLEALQAERLAVISEVSVRQIEAHLDNALAFERAGVISRNEVLETEVRLAEAQAQAIEARSGVLLARSNLAFQMGLPADRPIAPARIDPASIPTADSAYDTLATAAVAQREDLHGAKARVEQAAAGVDVAQSLMWPELSVLAAHEHTTGQAFMLRNQFFLGAQLSWNFWEWGATYHDIDRARAQLRQARSRREEMEETVKLQVRQAHVRRENAREQLRVAEKTVGQAQENLRIVDSRFQAQAATTTQVLDAQALLARAQVQQTTAQYRYLQAEAALRHAMGQAPSL